MELQSRIGRSVAAVYFPMASWSDSFGGRTIVQFRPEAVISASIVSLSRIRSATFAHTARE
jgi:hypothetical protein